MVVSILLSELLYMMNIILDKVLMLVFFQPQTSIFITIMEMFLIIHPQTTIFIHIIEIMIFLNPTKHISIYKIQTIIPIGVKNVHINIRNKESSILTE